MPARLWFDWESARDVGGQWREVDIYLQPSPDDRREWVGSVDIPAHALTHLMALNEASKTLYEETVFESPNPDEEEITGGRREGRR